MANINNKLKLNFGVLIRQTLCYTDEFLFTIKVDYTNQSVIVIVICQPNYNSFIAQRLRPIPTFLLELLLPGILHYTFRKHFYEVYIIFETNRLDFRIT